MKAGKWKIIRIMYLCYCGLCFENRNHFVQHLKDCKRWPKKHFAMDYSVLPGGFKIYQAKPASPRKGRGGVNK